MVFQTAPPHPASNARCTCGPELLGGPDASKNGLGERIPAKSMLSSAMLLQESAVNRGGGELAVLDGHHRGSGFRQANAIAAGKNALQVGFELLGHLHVAVPRGQPQLLS